MIERRQFLIASAAMTALWVMPAGATTTIARRSDAATRLRSLESDQARLGVCLLDTANGEFTGTRLDEH